MPRLSSQKKRDEFAKTHPATGITLGKAHTKRKKTEVFYEPKRIQSSAQDGGID